MKFSYAQLTLGSLVKLGFFANLAIWLIISLIIGFNDLVGDSDVRVGDSQVDGIAALITVLLMGVTCAVGGTVAFTIGALLVRLLGSRAPMLDISEPDQVSLRSDLP